MSLKETLNKMLEKKDKESVEKFVSSLTNYFPPSDDVSITVLKKGNHEYVIDRRGMFVVSISQDEYLPFMSASEKRVTSVPKDVMDKIISSWKDILVELVKLLEEYVKKYPSLSAKLNEVKEVVNQ
ncbi:MAG: hypothetical protein K1T65_06880 [Candidatus Aramenus sp.]|nr:hypothetical protein [Candidatus Aramenus sp.]